jgi:hypothetical protein
LHQVSNVEGFLTLRGEAVWCALIASLLLTPLGLLTGSWIIWWIAAHLSVAVSFAGIFSIGAATFLLSCLQLALAIALRRSPGGVEWKIPLLLGLLVWGIVVPGQILLMAAVGKALLGWYYAFPLAAIVGTIIVFFGGFAKPHRS